MNILVTVCARGGSKGIKGKNIKPLAGKPLIAHSIETAKKWGLARHIVCSTDSEEIAEVAKRYGAEVPFMRPDELATDMAGKVDVIRHAWKESEKAFNETFDVVVDLDVTNPIRSVDDLNGCLEAFRKQKPDVLFSVVKARKSPYFNMVELSEDGSATLCKAPEQNYLRRQDVPAVYSLNSCIYLYNPVFLKDEQNNSVFSGKTAVYEMSELSSHEVDRVQDFEYVDYLMSKLKAQGGKNGI